MKEFAIIGPTACGKTDLSIKIAKKFNAIILSLDSLSLYKEIDIASAKPSIKERDDILHFGIDLILPNENFNVVKYFEVYKDAKQFAQNANKNLIIVGGSSFYLKTLISGISNLPKIDNINLNKVLKLLQDEKAYELLIKIDPIIGKKISQNDKYRIEKALLIYFQTGYIPSKWYEENSKDPIIQDLIIFNIQTDKSILKNRIFLRTQKMLNAGLIDEVALLEHKYTQQANSLKAIGLIEVIDYLNNKIKKQDLIDLISTHTSQLAKRQITFNNGQFENCINSQLENMQKVIEHNIFK